MNLGKDKTISSVNVLWRSTKRNRLNKTGVTEELKKWLPSVLMGFCLLKTGCFVSMRVLTPSILLWQKLHTGSPDTVLNTWCRPQNFQSSKSVEHAELEQRWGGRKTKAPRARNAECSQVAAQTHTHILCHTNWTNANTCRHSFPCCWQNAMACWMQLTSAVRLLNFSSSFTSSVPSEFTVTFTAPEQNECMFSSMGKYSKETMIMADPEHDFHFIEAV